jgi:hypothetical protein
MRLRPMKPREGSLAILARMRRAPMPYLLRRTGDGAYVAPDGSHKIYTRDRERARRFTSREAAEANRCGNEYVEKETA